MDTMVGIDKSGSVPDHGGVAVAPRCEVQADVARGRGRAAPLQEGRWSGPDRIF